MGPLLTVLVERASRKRAVPPEDALRAIESSPAGNGHRDYADSNVGDQLDYPAVGAARTELSGGDPIAWAGLPETPDGDLRGVGMN